MVVESKVSEAISEANPLDDTCPIVNAIKEIGGVWKLIIIRYLSDGPQGFNELMKHVPEVNSKTLASTLKYLEEHEIIIREIESTRPFRVKYSLSPKGISLESALADLKKWGEEWIDNSGRPQR